MNPLQRFLLEQAAKNEELLKDKSMEAKEIPEHDEDDILNSIKREEQKQVEDKEKKQKRFEKRK